VNLPADAMIPKPVMNRHKDFLCERLSVRAAMKPAVIEERAFSRERSVAGRGNPASGRS
jgi:hypothetical protein